VKDLAVLFRFHIYSDVLQERRDPSLHYVALPLDRLGTGRMTVAYGEDSHPSLRSGDVVVATHSDRSLSSHDMLSLRCQYQVSGIKYRIAQRCNHSAEDEEMGIAQENAQRIVAGTPPLSADDAIVLGKEIPDWTLKDSMIERTFTFDGFRQAVDFVNRVADIAEREDHHPDICISYNKVRLQLSTHRIHGLSRNDFIVAAKVDEIPR
jgi:4a-hydroxytetrahydrobiopterin dehydratase